MVRTQVPFNDCCLTDQRYAPISPAHKDITNLESTLSIYGQRLTCILHVPQVNTTQCNVGYP